MKTTGTIISHLYKKAEDAPWIIQTNDEHQRGVAEMAAAFAGQFGLPSFGKALGLLHDKGKERHAFQQYIRMANGLPVEDKRHYVDHHHAFAGGIIAKNLFGNAFVDLLCNPIISHHTGLHDFCDVENVLREKQLPQEISVEGISVDKALLGEELRSSPFATSVSASKENFKHFHHLSRVLFSCLVDADRLDTERFMDFDSWQNRQGAATIAELLPKLEAYIGNLQADATDTEINRLRRKVQEECGKASPGAKGFYSLTVPTGGGKTLSSLLWAMKHAVTHGMSRVVIAIPYTSIIVQTAGLLKQVLGEENVLEHHANFNPDDIKDEKTREKARLATENWDYPIIVTTNVQLFESMFSNKPSACRKLHNI